MHCGNRKKKNLFFVKFNKKCHHSGTVSRREQGLTILFTYKKALCMVEV